MRSRPRATRSATAQPSRARAGRSDRRPARRDPLRWARRALLPWAGRLAVLLGLALVAAWAAGRALNDERLWSQWLWWLPTLAVAAAAALAAAFSRACEALGLRLAGASGRPLLLAAAVALLGWWAIAEARLPRLFTSGPRPARPTLSVGYWNLSWSRGDARAGGPGFAADVLIAANPRPGEGRRQLIESLLARQRAAGDDPGPDQRAVHLVGVLGGSVVASRDPILRAGEAWSEALPGAWTASRNGAAQNGVAFVTLDTIDRLGRETTIWIVDAPSDPFVARDRIMGALARSVRGWNGPVRAPDALGRWRRLEPDTAGFPAPDLIIGDFNATRGSRSIRRLVGDRAESHAAVGIGPDRTFHTLLPLWAIDLAYAGDGWRWVRSATLTVGGPHRAVLVEAEAPVPAPSRAQTAEPDAASSEPKPEPEPGPEPEPEPGGSS